MPGHCAGRGSPHHRGSKRHPALCGSCGGRGAGINPPRGLALRPTQPVASWQVRAQAWVQLRAGHPEKGTLVPQSPRQPREAAPHCLRGPGLQGG